MQNITIISAFTAGILSFFSPCVFPLLGVYISIITGTNLKNLKNKNK
ncbi:MAG: cytochrome c biogenesis protein CcdA, partial [Elusimicrobiota bacterium]|nr:cytochrome c biogenesis protein CcdA [Elusimicrobiota bacterium]